MCRPEYLIWANSASFRLHMSEVLESLKIVPEDEGFSTSGSEWMIGFRNVRKWTLQQAERVLNHTKVKHRGSGRPLYVVPFSRVFEWKRDRNERGSGLFTARDNVHVGDKLKTVTFFADADQQAVIIGVLSGRERTLYMYRSFSGRFNCVPASCWNRFYKQQGDRPRGREIVGAHTPQACFARAVARFWEHKTWPDTYAIADR